MATEIAQAVDWLAAQDLEPPSPPERAAAAFRATPSAVREGRIPVGVGRRVERALARHLLARAGRSASFVGDREPIATGVLYLALNDRGRALSSLLRAAPAAAELGVRFETEVWSALGDLYHLAGDEGAEEAFGRALAIAPEHLEPARLRCRALAELYATLARAHGPGPALQRLLVEARLVGLVRIPARDPWYAARLPGWEAELANLTEDSARARARRFTLLFLADRTNAEQSPDPERRLRIRTRPPPARALRPGPAPGGGPQGP